MLASEYEVPRQKEEKMSQKKCQEGRLVIRGELQHYALRQVQHQECSLSQCEMDQPLRAPRGQQSPGSLGWETSSCLHSCSIQKQWEKCAVVICNFWFWLVCNFYFLLLIFSLPSGWYSTFKSLKEGNIPHCLCRDFRFSTFLSAGSVFITHP